MTGCTVQQTSSLIMAQAVPPRKKKPRGLNLVELAVNEDGKGVTLSIDLPPALSITASPGEWKPAEVVEHVEWECRQLRSKPSPGLVSISVEGPPAMTTDDEGEAIAWPSGAAPPPLIVSVRLRGADASPYFTEEGFKVRILLDEFYPRTRPEINFMQIIHHFFLDNDNGLPHMFYELLGDLVEAIDADTKASKHDNPAPGFNLRATLQLLKQILDAPLHPCDGCDQQFKGFAVMHRSRLITIKDYTPFRANPQLFGTGAGEEVEWPIEWLHPELRLALYGDGSESEAAASAVNERLHALLHECVEGVYSFPFLTDDACAALVGEVDAYDASGLPTARPNSMNKYGLVLNEVGLEAAFDGLQRAVLQPVARLLFPIEGASLDRHHAFVVQYQEGKDLGLDMHTDNSDVTFNICLGREFEGAGLTFCGYMGQAHHRCFTYRHEHKKGHCVMHLGRRRHGADDISTGERLNLIIWNTNLAYRNSATCARTLGPCVRANALRRTLKAKACTAHLSHLYRQHLCPGATGTWTYKGSIAMSERRVHPISCASRTRMIATTSSKSCAPAQSQGGHARAFLPLSPSVHRAAHRYKEKPAMANKMQRRGWCPPLFAQHDAPSVSSPAEGTGASAGGDGEDAAILSDPEELRRALSSIDDSMPVLSNGQIM